MARQTGLGKGLGALIPEAGDPPAKNAAAGKATGSVEAVAGASFRELPVEAVDVNPFQPRSVFDEEGLVALTASIREVGVLQPILVRALDSSSFELIAGERRWRAAKRAGLKTVPAIVRDIEDLTSLEHALVENLHREDLGPLEEAAAFQQLMGDFGLTQEEVGKRVGKSRSAVTNALRLMQLPGPVQSLLVDREITAGHARALLGLPSKQAQEDMAKRVIAEELSVRAVEALVRSEVESQRSALPKKKKKTARSAAVLEVEQTLAEHLATSVNVSISEKRSRLVIDFADLKDLSRIYDILMG